MGTIRHGEEVITDDRETDLDQQRETSGVFYSKRGQTATQDDYGDEWWVGSKPVGAKSLGQNQKTVPNPADVNT